MRTIDRTQVAIGTVVDGKVVVEGVPLLERSVVAVIARGADEGFALSDAQEDELLEAIAEIDRGAYIGLGELLRSLPHQG